jgi:uncharacterized protein YjiK
MAGCKKNRTYHKYIRLKGYEKSNPFIVYLPETVAQISGIAYYHKDSSIFCIDDNIGELYKFPLYKKKVLQSWPFSRETDHEELVYYDSTFYVLISNGSIEAFRFRENGSLIKEQFTTSTSLEQREYEAMIYDTARKQFLLVCKDCEDDSTNTTSVYGVDFARKEMLPEPVFIIDHRQIEKLVNKTISKFKPSGAGVHPVTGDFYYVSAINDLLLVTDRNGVVKEASALDRNLFKQPEGIAFKPDGTLLISNEFANIGTATLLLYRYTNPENNTQ